MNDDKPRFGGDDPLDRAIDRAVRAMMHIDPRAGFRRRVLSRIEARSWRPAWFPRLAFAAAALAVLVLTVVVIRRGGPAPDVPQAILAGPQIPAPPLPMPKDPGSTAASGRRDAGPKSHRRDGLIDMPRVRNLFGPPTGRVAGAALTDAPVSPPLDESGVATAASGEDAREISGVAPLRIAPLDVKPLQIAPLGLAK